MKSLLIANGDFFSTFGGGQVYVKNVVDEMIRRRSDLCVFSFVTGKDKGDYKLLNYKGIPLYEFYAREVGLIKEIINPMRPDIIHAHAGKAFFAEISNQLAIPIVITAHHGGITCPAGALMDKNGKICRLPVSQTNCSDCVSQRRLLSIAPSFLHRKKSAITIRQKMKEWKTIIDYTDCMIAPSDAIATNMQLNGLASGKIVVLPHGIPDNPSGLSSDNSTKVKFFYIGRIDYVKGIHNLLAAFTKLNPTCCELHLIGDTSKRYGRRLVQQYKKYPHIVFHGKIAPDMVSGYIRQFDVLVHPAICLEVFGLNISEALQQSKPVIVTRCGGAEMQVMDKENGLLVEPNDIEALTSAMQWMIDHPEERNRMQRQTRNNVITMETHVDRLFELYRKTMQIGNVSRANRLGRFANSITIPNYCAIIGQTIAQ